MGITLSDPQGVGPDFNINFWHWRALVEAVRRTDVLPRDRIERLHEPCCGNGLTSEESRTVADALEVQVLPALAPQARLLLDGTITFEPDDGTFHKGADAPRNYSTNRDVVLKFIGYLRTCAGFEVL